MTSEQLAMYKAGEQWFINQNCISKQKIYDARSRAATAAAALTDDDNLFHFAYQGACDASVRALAAASPSPRCDGQMLEIPEKY